MPVFAPEDPPREKLVEASEIVAVLFESCRAIVPPLVVRDGDFIVVVMIAACIDLLDDII